MPNCCTRDLLFDPLPGIHGIHVWILSVSREKIVKHLAEYQRFAISVLRVWQTLVTMRLLPLSSFVVEI